MSKEILPGIYRTEIPLPQNPLRAVNSYLVKGRDRFLIIDTGMNREECQKAMLTSLERLGVDLNKTDFFLTHLHVDHTGLATILATETSKIYYSETEASASNAPGRWQDYYEETYCSHGFPKEEMAKATAAHPGVRYGSNRTVDYHLVKEGDNIDIGDYSFQCVETPGHTPGHMCLYEANKKILVSGDHILAGITPNIAWWQTMENPLKEYLASLEKVYPLDVALVLPGHRGIFNDHRKRIRELQEHHRLRLNEVLAVLRNGAKTAYQVAPCISWDVDYGSWDAFPPGQKWFAMGETLAHLRYLEVEGRTRSEKRGDHIVFSAV